MFSQFFIERPIFASVISISIVIAGSVTLLGLPVSQYPEITPPTVEVSAIYPGANAQVISETVAAPIEQQVNGVENMIYMSSTSAGDGSYKLTVTFEVGTNLDIARMADNVIEKRNIRQGQLTDGMRISATSSAKVRRRY